jgi:hypothetical protein
MKFVFAYSLTQNNSLYANLGKCAIDIAFKVYYTFIETWNIF